ncbi:nucleotide sugar dehydrogenase [Porticoccaceae bacterium]|nr:nucleotide sugar dehydrogenase [Porticoccaceae bacterium]
MTDYDNIDVTIVGGAGHVGLPLCLAFAEIGLRVLVLDINEQALKTIAEGKMPHLEFDAEPALKRALDGNFLEFTSSATNISPHSAIILTIGTPVDEFLNPIHDGVKSCIDDLLPNIVDGQLLILRSTIYPGTTDWLNDYLNKKGRKLELAFCPERVVQGHSMKELRSMPQIVSGASASAENSAAELFQMLASSIVRVNPKEAEFAKLFSNAYRYIEFAAANQFYMIAQDAGVDFYKIHHAVTKDYPRMKNFPRAGFAAGPCLFKDTMQLAAFARNKFGLGHDAMLVNEGLVLHVIDEITGNEGLADKTVGLLGMAFKSECDDIRSSLSYKLKKSLSLHTDNVLCTDPFVTTDPSLIPVEEVIEKSDILVLCTPHAAYKELDFGSTPVYDMWGFYS